MNSLLKIEQLSKTYGGKPVFSGLNLHVLSGRHLLVTGPSGCGKTTLLRLLAGLETPEEGVIHLNGRVASTKGMIKIPPHQRGLSMVFQDLGLWPNLTVMQNVMVGLSRLKLPKRERTQRAREALGFCELTPLADRHLQSLSGGELQRLALARAIAIRPQLLLLDEPFFSLDIVLKLSLLEMIRRLCVEIGCTVIMASHHPADAQLLGAELAVLEDGGIREQGTLAELCRQPTSRTLIAWRKELPEFAP